MGPVAPRHVGSSQTRARTRVPCIGRQILNHCTTREAPLVFLKYSFLHVIFFCFPISYFYWILNSYYFIYIHFYYLYSLLNYSYLPFCFPKINVYEVRNFSWEKHLIESWGCYLWWSHRHCVYNVFYFIFDQAII